MDKNNGFSLSNLVYVVWFGFYFSITWFLLGANGEAFLISCLIYGVSISLSLTPVGEEIHRRMNGMRPLVLKEEVEIIKPLFEEVYEEAKRLNPGLKDNVKLYIEDSMEINACAIGRTTVSITKGTLQFMNEDEIRGMLAHEIGHIVHGDTKMLLMTSIGNGVFNIAILVLRFLIRLVKGIISVIRGAFPFLILSWIMGLFVDLLILLFVLAGEVILMANSRRNEYLADRYACDIGYGKELRAALVKLESTSTTGKQSIMNLLKATHPRLIDRIMRLDGMGGIESTNEVIT